MSKSETETKEERRARKALKKEKKEKKRDRDEPTEATSPITSIESEAEPSAKKLKAEDGSAKTTKVSGNPSIDKFSICDETKASLRKRGIEELFPIQALTFDKIMEGKDIMGRARTGMGKTLAFALPVIEMLLKNKSSQTRGRAPRVVCMAPTRELAKQVAAEFESTAPSLATVCIYGGASYRTQNDAFRAGVDVLVGTTGRVIDHIDRGNLRLHNCEFLILDEADTMLEMGFREDVQKVFAAMQEVQQADGKKQQQTLLFSATIPSWITQVANTYMQKDYEYVNLVGDMDDQASTDVQHLAIPCHWQGKASMLANLLNLYGTRQSRSIIFAETKKDCNELSVHPEIKQECQVLHGDIAQDQRETTMKAFRDGKLRLLIATDVAARGLDMNVDLVVNSEPPRKFGGNADVDTYVHRSGRTGRAGRKGVCITLYTPRQLDLLKQIEHKIGNKFVMRGPPSQEEMLKASAAKAWKEIENVDENMIKIFEDKAEEIIESMGAKKCVASALAVITGHTKPPRRTSLMSGAPDYVTVQFLSYNPIRAKGYVWNAVNREFPEDLANDIQQMTIAEDQMSACFDLPEKGLEKLNQLMEEQGEECIFTIPKELPKLQAQKFVGGGRGGGRGGRGGRGGSRGGRFGQSGRGGGRGGRGRRF